MERIGYIYSSIDNEYIKEQIDAIKDFGVKRTFIEEDNIKTLKSGDELVVYELKCLGKTVIQLSTLLFFFRNKGIKLTIIRTDNLFDQLTEEQFSNIIFELAEMESFVRGQITTKGIQAAKRSGRVGGRPKTPEDKIKEIRYLYYNQSYTLREIAKKCDISLGTAYKYTKD